MTVFWVKVRPEILELELITILEIIMTDPPYQGTVYSLIDKQLLHLYKVLENRHSADPVNMYQQTEQLLIFMLFLIIKGTIANNVV